MIDEVIKRSKIVEVAKTWLGTPFHDCAGVKSCGVDCAYLPVRVVNEAKILDHVLPDPPVYSPQIMLHCQPDQREIYIETIKNHTREIKESEARQGDFVVYKVGRIFSHGGIIVSWPNYIIHPIRGRGVIGSHGTEEGFLRRRARRFFSLF